VFDEGENDYETLCALVDGEEVELVPEVIQDAYAKIEDWVSRTKKVSA
jgi:hypothetical protein